MRVGGFGGKGTTVLLCCCPLPHAALPFCSFLALLHPAASCVVSRLRGALLGPVVGPNSPAGGPHSNPILPETAAGMAG